MFSKTAEYALRAAIFIAQKSSVQKKLGIEQIARSIDAPPSFTAKILQLLTKDNRIISSVRGVNGGFYIAEEARNLSVRTVLEVIGENKIFTECVLGLKDCTERKPCPMHVQYKPIKEQLIRLFEEKTIGQLAGDLTEGKAFLINTGKQKRKR
ncbi:RrF2 family transcriptional regulator [Flavisolibacter ginsenosidimutans]|uniref:Rrf2 family transcriptional regulator n=1 Tax=Flavisolibacter ginsenosidimutans TaxID=661481 RepID=A0A5B8UJ84_9BACT|nr:Rrf2 family transcriptional regulator [Flavisolibacter ginsenosidimutans]QEC56065.1 Rrf2 family transcriptional regulator [Flavisolibacter ginsenosidimutans]